MVEIIQDGRPTEVEGSKIIRVEQNVKDISYRIARILQIAKPIYDDPKAQIPKGLKVGDTVILDRRGGSYLNIDNKEYWMIQPSNILAKIVEKTQKRRNNNEYKKNKKN